MKLMNRLTRTALVAAALALAPACDDDHDHDHGEHSLEEEACEHLADGPATAVTAAATPSGDLPDVNVPHTRVDIAIPVLGHGSHQGYVALESAAEGHYHLFLGQDVPLKVLDASDAEVPFAATEQGSEACDDVAVHHEVHLGVGRYILAIEQTPEATLQLIVETSEE